MSSRVGTPTGATISVGWPGPASGGGCGIVGAWRSGSGLVTSPLSAGDGAGRGVLRSAASSAVMSSSAVDGRSAGFFASPAASTSSTAAGSPGCSIEASGGGSDTCA